jgi:hypothetical protein
MGACGPTLQLLKCMQIIKCYQAHRERAVNSGEGQGFQPCSNNNCNNNYDLFTNKSLFSRLTKTYIRAVF